MSSLGRSYEYHEEDGDGSKTLISFIVGLLIGGLLIWVFSAPVPEEKESPSIDGPTRAEDACLAQGGIPIYENGNNLTDCKKL